MAKWERLIVYPLLLVALFFGVSSNNGTMLEATETVEDEIRTRRVVIVGDDGQTKAVLGVNEQDGGSLNLWGPEETFILLSTTREQSGLHLHKGSSLAGMIATKEGSGLGIHDFKGVLRAEMRAMEELDSYCTIYGTDGRTRARLGVDGQGDGFLAMRGSGDAEIALGATKEASLLLLSKGLSQVGIGATSEMSILEAYNSKGTLGAFLAASDVGGSLSINNHNGFAGAVLRTSNAGGGIVDVLDGGVKCTLSAAGGGSLELRGFSGSTSLKAGSIHINNLSAYPNTNFRWP